MIRYVVKRLLLVIPVLLGVSLIIFSIMSFSSGDPARQALGKDAPEEQVEAYREKLGLNDPLPIRYIRYIAGILHGDFGKSYIDQTDVLEKILTRFPITFNLALFATVITVALAIPIGIISATKQYSFFDTGTMVLALVAASMPSFWLGLMLLMVFSAKLGWFSAFGAASFKDYVLPAITLSLFVLSILIRYTRSTMLETIRQDYVTTARAKGASEFRAIGIHAMKNAMIPIITVIGARFASFLCGTVVVETVFSMPGIGTMMISAINQRDTITVTGTVIFLASMLTMINLLIDIVYMLIDPRLKSQLKK